ncbi:hypothetical protein EOA23_12815 [Mesorhizobium sp. M2A.F.Ca.ET.042.01.1.1]|nr:hypothetical protein EOA23_12815 [Mesorhizobium sp. M2A.F.Ca.ET.042.01.1.1]
MCQCLALLPLWEKVSPKATDEGCSRESQRLTSLEHPSSVSALRADPPSPTRGEGKTLHHGPSAILIEQNPQRRMDR